MSPRADFVNAQRREAWAYGRELRESLLTDYRNEYGKDETPPPAKIIDELIRDFLHFDLHYDPLPKDIFAKITWHDGRTAITVNGLTNEIQGVKDEVGVQNVGKFHEAIHGLRDAPPNNANQALLAGFDLAREVTCYRATKPHGQRSAWEREFWAEEAGRAAAISYRHLHQ